MQPFLMDELISADIGAANTSANSINSSFDIAPVKVALGRFSFFSEFEKPEV